MSEHEESFNLESIFGKTGRINKDMLRMYAENLLPKLLVWEVENYLLENEEGMKWVEYYQAQPSKSILQNIEQKFYQQQTAEKRNVLIESLDKLKEILNDLIEKAIPSPRYEKMIQLQFRTVTTKNSFKILSPQAEQLCVDVIDFQFEGNNSKGIEVRLFDEKGRRVLPPQKLPIGENQWNLDLKEYPQIISGLYYWQLIVRDEKPITNKVYVFVS